MSKEAKLHEAIADIAYVAGFHKYHSGDSRGDVQNYITWAREFETKHKDTRWDEGPNDYIEAIEEFTLSKIGETENSANDE